MDGCICARAHHLDSGLGLIAVSCLHACTHTRTHTISWKSEHAPIDRSELRNTIEVEPIHIPPGEFPAANREHAPPSNVFYGTRLSTVILIRRDGNVTFIERDIWCVEEATSGVVKSDSGHDRVFRFQIQPQGRRF